MFELCACFIDSLFFIKSKNVSSYYFLAQLTGNIVAFVIYVIVFFDSTLHLPLPIQSRKRLFEII